MYLVKVFTREEHIFSTNSKLTQNQLAMVAFLCQLRVHQRLRLSVRTMKMALLMYNTSQQSLASTWSTSSLLTLTYLDLHSMCQSLVKDQRSRQKTSRG